MEAGDRRAVVGVVRDPPFPEQLLEGELAVEDVALRQSDDRLDVLGHQDLGIGLECGRKGYTKARRGANRRTSRRG